MNSYRLCAVKILKDISFRSNVMNVLWLFGVLYPG